jgi:hypothetical protein
VLLSTCPALHLRNADRAVDFAQKSVDRTPHVGRYWHLLGVAQYQAGRWAEAIESPAIPAGVPLSGAFGVMQLLGLEDA